MQGLNIERIGQYKDGITQYLNNVRARQFKDSGLQRYGNVMAEQRQGWEIQGLDNPKYVQCSRTWQYKNIFVPTRLLQKSNFVNES